MNKYSRIVFHIFVALFVPVVTLALGSGGAVFAAVLSDPADSDIVSDDFAGCALNTGLWTVVDPVGDGSVAMAGGQLELTVPSGTSHDAWSSNATLRAMQPASNTDFEIESKFESGMQHGFQLQGLIVEQDAANYLRFDFHSDGFSTKLFAARIVNNSPTALYASTIANSGQTPLYMQVQRDGDAWTQRYSLDGASWTQGASFSHAISVNNVGIFAGNAHGNPAHTAVVDYFFNTANPIAPEDGEVAQTTLTTGTSGNGSLSVDPQQASYDCDDAVTLTATPAAGWLFTGWSGDATGTDNPLTLTMESDKNVTATFAEAATHTLTVTTSGNGAVTRNPDQPEYDTGDAVTLTATPDAGWVFTGWSGDATGTENPLALTMESDKNVTATFAEAATHTLTVATSGNGAVTRDPDQPEYDTGDAVTLTATPDAGWVFTGWSGDAGGTDNPLTLIIDGDKNVTATFEEAPTYALTVSSTGSGSVARDPDQPEYNTGDAVTLTATPAAGWVFTGWSGDAGGTDNPLTVTMDGDKTVTATFVEEAVTYALTTNTSGNGSVARDPDQPEYDAGDAVTLTAAPDAGWVFTGWSGDAGGTENPLTVTMDGDKTVTATFVEEAVTYALTTNTSGNGSVARDPDQPEYNAGDAVTLTAAPDAGWVFTGWSGDAGGTDNPLTVTMDGDKTVTATFAVESNLVSDDFASCALDTNLWTVVDPVGDGAVRLTGGQLELEIPPGTAHDVWNSNAALRVMQPTNDANFDAEVKFESSLQSGFQLQGIIVEQDAANYLRFDFYTDGYSTNVFAARVVNNNPTALYANNIGSSGQAPLYMRVSRDGDAWTQHYSFDGASWTQAATFSHGLTMSSIGVFAGNANGNPAHTAVVDYFFNTASPIAPEDGGVVPMTLTTNTNGNGSLAADPQQASYTCGDAVTLTATPDAGYVFSGWSGDAAGTENPLTLTMDGDKSVTANFVEAQTYTLSTAASGSGTVTRDPDQPEYDPGDVVTLTAAPAVGYVFSGWSGDAAGADNPLTLTMDGDKTVTAIFTQVPTYALTTAVSGSGTVTRNPDQPEYNAGHVVTLSATPAAGWLFTGWSGDAGGTDNPLTVTMDGDKTVTATFVEDTATYQLTIATSGSGTVTLDPDQPEYDSGDVVTLTAAPAAGYTFSGWSGDATGTTNPLALTMDGDKSITTTFVETDLVIDVWYGDEQRFGHLGVPQRWVNILGNVSGPNGVSSLVYSLNGGPERTLSMGPDSRRLSRTGDFNIDLAVADLVAGANQVVIRASNSSGQQVTKTVTVQYTDGQVWALPYSIDWNGVSAIEDVAQVVDGKWSITPEGLRIDEIGYDRLVAVGDMAWTDYEVTVPIELHSVDWDGAMAGGLSGEPGLGLLIRWEGHTDSPAAGWQPKSGWEPNGDITWWRWTSANSADLRFLSGYPVQAFTPEVGVRYLFKVQVQTQADEQSLYRVKVWEEGQPEPVDWNIQRYGIAGTLGNGSLLLLAHHVDATFGNVTVTPITQPSGYTLSVATNGNGSVTRDPSQSSYDPGDAVTLTAVPQAGYVFSGWSGDAGGNSNPLTVSMDDDKSITATFVEESSSHVLNVTSSGGGTVTRTPDQPSYDPGSQVTLTAAPEAGYVFSGWSGDASGAANPLTVTMDGDKNIAATFAVDSDVASDDFASCALNESLWSVVDPMGDGGVSVVDGKLALTVPGGTSHDVWSSNASLRVMQPASDTDFEVEVKFESGVQPGFQLQGILVEQDGGNYLRLDFYSDGSSTRLFTAQFTNNSPTVLYNNAVAAGGQAPLYMRVRRAGDQWTQFYSTDGANWTQAANFSHALSVSRVGVFAGNAGGNPAHTAVVDYFFNAASPIVPEDGAVPAPTLSTATSGSGSVSVDPQQASYACGDEVTLTATPQSGYVFSGWSGDAGGTDNPLTLTMNGDKSVTANFAEAATYELTVAVSGSGSVNRNPEQSAYNPGDVVTLTATPAAGYVFSGWSGDASGAANPLTVTMDGDKNITATFAEEATTYELTVTTSGNGAVNRDPEQTQYQPGDTVTLTAVPQSGYVFSGWSGDATGMENPLTVTMDDDKSITATFVEESETYVLPIVINGGGAVTREPDKPSYSPGEQVTLTATPDAGYVFAGWSGDATGMENPLTVTMDGDKNIVATFAVDSDVASDDFASCALNESLWSVVDPMGDGSVSVVDGKLALTVPGGTNHDVWSSNSSLRVMQPASDTDFEVEVKFESGVQPGFQLQGILVEQDGDNYLRLDFYSDGSNTRLFAAQFTNNSPTVLYNNVVAAGGQAPLYMRVRRAGDQWTQFYSTDGANWTQAANFSHALSVSRVGVFAGNAGGNPAHTAVVDYFFNVASPIVPEDGAVPAPTLSTATSGSGSVSVDPQQASYACGDEVTLTATPQSGYVFSGWSGDASGSGNPLVLVMDGDKDITATFAPAGSYSLHVNSASGGEVESDPGEESYSGGEVVTLSADPLPGWRFAGWSGDLSGSDNPAVITMDDNKNITALFTEEETVSLTIETVGAGTVSSQPSGFEFAYGTTITLTAVAEEGWHFAEWGGDLLQSVWWDEAWRYRLPITIGADGAVRTDKPVNVAVNFTDTLDDLGVGEALNVDSLRVVEVDADGQIVAADVPFQFDPAADFDAATNAHGTLVLILQGTTAEDAARTYHVYFDTGGGFAPAAVASQVTLVDDVMDEGQSSIQITTPAATYFYQKAAGAFSSLVDADGNDWINYHPSGGSAGSYRGIPNMAYPYESLHPGATDGITTIVSEGPLKVTLHTVTTNGEWEVLWEIYPHYAQMTALTAEHDYWFLYEGTPGGVLEPATDFVVRSDGTQTAASVGWANDIAGEEWVYFGDPGVERSIYLAQHESDTATDFYQSMNGEMTVFGFGRQFNNRLLSQTPLHFTVGLMDQIDYAPSAQTVRSAYVDVTVAVGAVETREMYESPTTNPLSLTLYEDMNITATFVEEGQLSGNSISSTPARNVAFNRDEHQVFLPVVTRTALVNE